MSHRDLLPISTADWLPMHVSNCLFSWNRHSLKSLLGCAICIWIANSFVELKIHLSHCRSIKLNNLQIFAQTTYGFMAWERETLQILLIRTSRWRAAWWWIYISHGERKWKHLHFIKTSEREKKFCLHHNIIIVAAYYYRHGENVSEALFPQILLKYH